MFNVDGIKNGEVTWYIPLEIKINRHKKQIDAVVTDLNSTDMFLGYDWLVKHNPEANWNTETIQFTRFPKSCRTLYQDILFRNRRIQPTDNQDKGQQEIGKKPDLTNLEDFPEYIWFFTYLFNKKKIWKATWTMRIKLWDKSNKRCF